MKTRAAGRGVGGGAYLDRTRRKNDLFPRKRSHPRSGAIGLRKLYTSCDVWSTGTVLE